MGQLVSLQGETDHGDNVLLEFMLVIALQSLAESSVQAAIYPLLMSERNADGSFAEFPFAELQRLPGTPCAATSSRAAKIMHMSGCPATSYMKCESAPCEIRFIPISAARVANSRLLMSLVRGKTNVVPSSSPSCSARYAYY